MSAQDPNQNPLLKPTPVAKTVLISRKDAFALVILTLLVVALPLTVIVLGNRIKKDSQADTNPVDFIITDNKSKPNEITTSKESNVILLFHKPSDWEVADPLDTTNKATHKIYQIKVTQKVNGIKVDTNAAYNNLKDLKGYFILGKDWNLKGIYSKEGTVITFDVEVLYTELGSDGQLTYKTFTSSRSFTFSKTGATTTPTGSVTPTISPSTTPQPTEATFKITKRNDSNQLSVTKDKRVKLRFSKPTDWAISDATKPINIKKITISDGATINAQDNEVITKRSELVKAFADGVNWNLLPLEKDQTSDKREITADILITENSQDRNIVSTQTVTLTTLDISPTPSVTGSVTPTTPTGSVTPGGQAVLNVNAKNIASCTAEMFTLTAINSSGEKINLGTIKGGKSTLSPTGLITGSTYAFGIQGTNYLTTLKTGILVSGQTEVNFGKLIVGDVAPAAGDNVIDAEDVAAMVKAIQDLKAADKHFDLNCDGQVEVIDYSLLIRNTAIVGDKLENSGTTPRVTSSLTPTGSVTPTP